MKSEEADEDENVLQSSAANIGTLPKLPLTLPDVQHKTRALSLTRSQRHHTKQPKSDLHVLF